MNRLISTSEFSASVVHFLKMYQFANYATLAVACEFLFRHDLHAQLLDCSVTAWISIIDDNREINLRILGNRPAFVSASPRTAAAAAAAAPHWTQR